MERGPAEAAPAARCQAEGSKITSFIWKAFASWSAVDRALWKLYSEKLFAGGVPVRVELYDQQIGHHTGAEMA